MNSTPWTNPRLLEWNRTNTINAYSNGSDDVRFYKKVSTNGKKWHVFNITRNNKWNSNTLIANLVSVKNFGCFMRFSKRWSFKYSAAREPPWPAWNIKNSFRNSQGNRTDDLYDHWHLQTDKNAPQIAANVIFSSLVSLS